jgi:hypothetical protein
MSNTRQVKTGKAYRVISAGLVAVVLVVLGGCARPPQDDAGAQLMRFENLRANRYAEIFLIGGNAITKNFKAGVYNSVGLNDSAGAGDTAPQALVEAIDTEALKEQYGVLGVHKNAPRLWVLDWIEANVGKERDFNGLKARWVMWLDVPGELISGESLAYKLLTGKRDTSFGFDKGKPVFILDDPEGNAYVMKSVNLITDPTRKYEDLETLGERLELAPGWQFRVEVLEQDLVLTPNMGRAIITLDDMGNVYDRVGGSYSNFKP